MKKIFVSGGGGFLASHTIEALEERGYKVVTNMRYSSAELPDYLENADIYYVDQRDKIGIRAIVEKSDGVINLAGILGTKSIDNPREFYENNVFGALNVYDACTEFNIPVVQIAVGNYFETNNYSNSKTAAERDLLMYTKFKGMKGNLVRGLNVIGPRQKVKHTGKIGPTFITKALNNEDISVYGGKDNCGLMDFVYVKDIANILIDVLIFTENNEAFEEGTLMDKFTKHIEKDGKVAFHYGNVFEAGTGEAHSVYEVAELIIKLTNSQSKIIEVPMRAGESNRSKVVATNPYPYNYTSLEDMLNETIEYYRNAKEIY